MELLLRWDPCFLCFRSPPMAVLDECLMRTAKHMTILGPLCNSGVGLCHHCSMRNGNSAPAPFSHNHHDMQRDARRWWSHEHGDTGDLVGTRPHRFPPRSSAQSAVTHRPISTMSNCRVPDHLPSLIGDHDRHLRCPHRQLTSLADGHRQRHQPWSPPDGERNCLCSLWHPW